MELMKPMELIEDIQHNITIRIEDEKCARVVICAKEMTQDHLECINRMLENGYTLLEIGVIVPAVWTTARSSAPIVTKPSNMEPTIEAFEASAKAKADSIAQRKAAKLAEVNRGTE